MVWLANPERYGQMQYRYCGKSGLRLPALSLGLWHNFGHVNALESQRAILRKAFDLGITHFDLANITGRLQEAQKRTLVACCGRILPLIAMN
ncbi:putative aldo/keto reductase [Escherichia coli]|nr:putative aldo/keto reductase [Escherichia coli]